MVNQRILVVDDDKSIVKILRGYLEQSGFEVLTAFDGNTALHMLRRERPDLLLLDLMLPDRDGWDMVRIIRADESLTHTPVIMLTARAEDNDKIIGLELGADDYITKPFNAREVVARVRAQLRRNQREISAETRILHVGGLKLDPTLHELTVDGTPVSLTRTEFGLLQTLMRHPGHTLSRDELLEKVMGHRYEGLGRALDTHIRNLRRKIEPDPSDPTYIHTVYGIGYRLMGAET